MSTIAVNETTRPITVRAMVYKITRDRMRHEKAMKQHDEQLTEIIINDPPRGRHRAVPIEAGFYLLKTTDEPKHIDDDFVAPTSLFELVNS